MMMLKVKVKWQDEISSNDTEEPEENNANMTYRYTEYRIRNQTYQYLACHHVDTQWHHYYQLLSLQSQNFHLCIHDIKVLTTAKGKGKGVYLI